MLINCAVLKPSNETPHTSKIIEEIISSLYPENYISVVQGPGRTVGNSDHTTAHRSAATPRVHRGRRIPHHFQSVLGIRAGVRNSDASSHGRSPMRAAAGRDGHATPAETSGRGDRDGCHAVR